MRECAQQQFIMPCNRITVMLLFSQIFHHHSFSTVEYITALNSVIYYLTNSDVKIIAIYLPVNFFSINTKKNMCREYLT